MNVSADADDYKLCARSRASLIGGARARYRINPYLDRSCMEAALDGGGCIVCVVGPGDFTDKGHFLVICVYDGEGFAIRDPASRENSRRTWTYERLSGQLQAMWALSADWRCDFPFQRV